MHLQLRGVTKRYGRVMALADFSLELPPGRIVAVIGLNGAGKTTLLRCLSGIVAPTRGEVRFDGQPFQRRQLDQRQRLMFLPDFPALFAGMNALQHIALVLRTYERDDPGVDDRILAALRDLDLLPLAEAPLETLSRGQLYKVAFSALLAVAPELWLLDEPFASGLDPQGLAIVKQRARESAAAGATIIYSTQILEIAERFCDLLCVIDHGRLRESFTREQLAALPPTGPDSLEARLRQFREPAA
ncbi:ABC transporter ATP-binding protein [Opitutus sp. ER46]|uniref:ABC transporter ATP-binding protein n=1 Tax=Opitutus sp. ER46 TaxID=2161864 RepID=UPI001304B2B8|nr:ABC transporter ATP-binding protein [Opitutus sp. ER46]